MTDKKYTTEIVTAYVSNNKVAPHELPKIVREVDEVLNGPRRSATSAVQDVKPKGEREAVQLVPVVPINESVTDEYIICLEDGEKLKFLKKHLRVYYDMTLEDYRTKWGLPDDYPMTAPSYSRMRSKTQKQFWGTETKEQKEKNRNSQNNGETAPVTAPHWGVV